MPAGWSLARPGLKGRQILRYLYAPSKPAVPAATATPTVALTAIAVRGKRARYQDRSLARQMPFGTAT